MYSVRVGVCICILKFDSHNWQKGVKQTVFLNMGFPCNESIMWIVDESAMYVINESAIRETSCRVGWCSSPWNVARWQWGGGGALSYKHCLVIIELNSLFP